MGPASAAPSILWPFTAVLLASLLAVGWFVYFGPGSLRAAASEPDAVGQR